MKNFLLLSLVCVILLCCKSKNEDSSSGAQALTSTSSSDTNTDNYVVEEQTTADGYEDGEYCATINYYNSSTGNSSTYTLEVGVENGELVQINWPNGGWLDSSHFDPPEVESDGSCSFSTYDGKDYDVQIDGTGGCGYSSSSPNEDDAEDEIESEEAEEEGDKISYRIETKELLQQIFKRAFEVRYRISDK